MKIGNNITLSCEIRPCANYQGVTGRIDVPVTLEEGDTVEDAIAMMDQIYRALSQPAVKRMAIMNGRAAEIPASTLPAVAWSASAPGSAREERVVVHQTTDLVPATEESDSMVIEKLLALSLDLRPASALPRPLSKGAHPTHRIGLRLVNDGAVGAPKERIEARHSVPLGEMDDYCVVCESPFCVCGPAIGSGERRVACS